MKGGNRKEGGRKREHMHACVAGSREMLVLTCLEGDSRGDAFQVSVVPGDGTLSLSHTSS